MLPSTQSWTHFIAPLTPSPPNLPVCRHHHHGLGSSGCCAGGGAAPAGAAHLPGGAACAAGAACCSAPVQRWFFAGGAATDLEMGGFKDSGEQEAAGENAEAVHSGLVPILAAAGCTEPNSSSSSSSSDGGFLKAAAGSRRGSQLSQQGPAAGDVPAALPQAPAPAATQAANLNMRGAVIHCIGDLVQSIGVCIAGALIWWHQVRVAEPGVHSAWALAGQLGVPLHPACARAGGCFSNLPKYNCCIWGQHPAFPFSQPCFVLVGLDL